MHALKLPNPAKYAFVVVELATLSLFLHAKDHKCTVQSTAETAHVV